MTPDNSANIELLNLILEEMIRKGSLNGILIVLRDGRVIQEKCVKEFECQEFAAMCASVLGSAEDLGLTVGGRKVRKIIAESEEQIIYIVECDERAFMVLIFDYNAIVEPILSDLDNYIQKIITTY